MFGMDGMLVDAGKIISFDLFDCGPLLLELFRHDDLNSSKLNSGKAAADVSVVNLKIKIKKNESNVFRITACSKLTLHLGAPNSIVPAVPDAPPQLFPQFL